MEGRQSRCDLNYHTGVIWLGVRAKLVLCTLLILVVVSFGFTLLQLKLLRGWVEEDLQERAVIFAREVAASIGDRAEFERGTLLEREVQQIMTIRRSVLQLEILRFTPDGTAMVATSEPSRPLPFTAKERDTVRRGRLVSRLVVDDTGRSWDVMAPVTIEGSVAGAIAAKFSLNRSDVREGRIRLWDLALTAASVVVMGLLTAGAVHVVVNRPIGGFMEALQRVQRGGSVPAITVGTADEFSVMARHFNEMVARIDDFNDELEAKVADATRELEGRYEEVQRLHEALFGMQRRLTHAERLGLAGRIMAEVAHEVGTPLHSVAGHFELLRGELDARCQTDAVTRRFTIIESQLARVTEIIGQLMDLTRREPERPTTVDLNRLIHETVELVRAGISAGHLVLRVETDPALPAVDGHANQLQQVLLNLLTNAIDATPANGTVTVRTQCGPDKLVVLEVTDTGHGIASPQVGHIFEPFFSTKASGRRTGLGLFITAQIVREHRGSIEVRSTEGEGTSFRVLLPPGGAA